ncbi:MAG: ABC transporter permease [Clostridiales bacterium]|nr:ABC transporter permease [Clostridiales bacterium]
MLFGKELKKICFSAAYLVFICFLVFSWYKNFYGVTEKEIAAAKRGDTAVSQLLSGGSILEKPEENAESYGTKQKEVPEKIMCGGTDMLIIEYLNNAYATYPYTYYKEVTLSEKEQEEILAVICEITGLTKEEIHNLPADYFPAVNGNIIHYGEKAEEGEQGGFTFQMGSSEDAETYEDSGKHFTAQVSYERFQELMKQVEKIVGKGSNYSMESLSQYYGLAEMTYEEATEEYRKTIYDDKVSRAFARLFCDYMTRVLGLYPVFPVVIFWMRDKRNHMNELINSKPCKTAKLVIARFLAMLTALLLPTVILSMESLIPLLGYSADTGIAIDAFAYLKYIAWWLLPTAMIVTSLGMFLTILTSLPIGIFVQFIWWFVDGSVTGLSGDTNIFTLMIRHNLLTGSEIIRRDFALLCINRGMFVIASVMLLGFSILIYDRKRGGKLNEEYFWQKKLGVFKNRFSSYLSK